LLISDYCVGFFLQNAAYGHPIVSSLDFAVASSLSFSAFAADVVAALLSLMGDFINQVRCVLRWRVLATIKLVVSLAE
jgi:hypothetical protein